MFIETVLRGGAQPPSSQQIRICDRDNHPGIQECPDELQQPLVPNPLRDLPHQFVVIDPIEKFL